MPTFNSWWIKKKFSHYIYFWVTHYIKGCECGFMLTLRLVLIKNCINLLTEIAVADSRCDVSWITDRNRGKIMSQWILMWQKTNRREKERSKERVKMVVEKFADLFSFCHPVQPGLFPQTLSVSLTVSWVSQEITELVFSSLSLWSLYR